MEDLVRSEFDFKYVYYYRVEETVTTFEQDQNKTKPFTHEKFFKGDSLKKCKERAVKYYWERFDGFDDAEFFLPFASPDNFKFGENAACSITLYLVEEYGDEINEYPVLGEDVSEMKDSWEIEEALLNREI